MAISGDRTQQQLNQYAINVIKKKLETIDGVGEVRVGGRRDRTIRVNLLPARMAAFGVAAQDIQDAFTREHLQVAGGFIVGGATEHLVKLDLEFHNMDDLEKMIVGFREGAPIRLKDIAEIEDGLSDFRQLARFNGQMAVGLGTVKIPNTNTVAIVRADHGAARQGNHPEPAAGDEDRHRPERRGVHRRDHQCAQGAPDRGHAARGAGGAVLPAQRALDAHHRHRHPGVAARRGGGDVLLRLHLQFGDDARAAAADRRRGRRLDRGAREHLPPPRAPRSRPDLGGDERQPRGHVRGARGDPVACLRSSRR